MWIKFKQAVKGYAIGQIVDLHPEDKAKGLIELEVAEVTEAPKAEDADVVKSFGEGLRDSITNTVKEVLAEATKSFSRGGLEFQEEAVIDVDNLCRYSRLKNFSNDRKGIERAYRFGMYCMGIYNNDPSTSAQGRAKSAFASERCKTLGIPLSQKDFVDQLSRKTSTTKNNTSAGFLVPEEFQNDLIDLRERYGVFRANTKVVPMSSDVRSDPRRRGGLTASFVDEVTASSYSDKTWDRVRLVAKKLMVLTKYSSELNEDAVISIGDDLAGEIAYAFANKEDQCGFIGDGSNTYGGIIGVSQALKNVSATPTSTIADVLGIWQSTANAYSSLTLTDFNKVVGLLPEFADGPNCKWYVHRTVWGQVMQKLATAAGGNRVSEIEGGALKKSFLGYDVVTTQVLPKVYAANQIVALLGDLSLGSRLGDRRETTIAMSDQFAFDTDAIVIRGTERFDIVVHDVGECSTQTARDPVMGLTAGPIVALMMT